MFVGGCNIYIPTRVCSWGGDVISIFQHVCVREGMYYLYSDTCVFVGDGDVISIFRHMCVRGGM